jgi:hypothetical protein
VSLSRVLYPSLDLSTTDFQRLIDLSDITTTRQPGALHPPRTDRHLCPRRRPARNALLYQSTHRHRHLAFSFFWGAPTAVRTSTSSSSSRSSSRSISNVSPTTRQPAKAQGPSTPFKPVCAVASNVRHATYHTTPHHTAARARTGTGTGNQRQCKQPPPPAPLQPRQTLPSLSPLDRLAESPSFRLRPNPRYLAPTISHTDASDGALGRLGVGVGARRLAVGGRR